MPPIFASRRQRGSQAHRWGCMFSAVCAAAIAIPAAGQGAPATARQLAREALELNPDLRYDPFGVLIRFAPGTPENVRAELRTMVGGEKVREYSLVPGLEKITTLLGIEDTIRLLGGLDFVRYVEPDYVIRVSEVPNDPDFGLQYAAHNTGQLIGPVEGIEDADMDLKQAWGLTTGDTSMIVAVIDTGAELTHEDLTPNIWNNITEVPNGVDDDGNGFVDDFNGWDFFDGDNDPTDTDGHGTSVAGIIGARGDNGRGIAGVMWRCKLMVLRVFGTNGGFTSDAIAALDYASNMNVHVSNNSWGSFDFSQSLRDTIEALQQIDHIFVAAAGNNDGNDNDTNPFYPASYDLENIISVAATDNRDRLKRFSNIGVNSVDLGAPGWRIQTTKLGNQYGFFTGTSASAPQVAGLVALARSARPDWSFSKIRRRILRQVRRIDALDGKTATGGVANAVLVVETRVEQPDRPTCTDLGAGSVRVEWVDNSDNETRFILQRMTKIGPRTWGVKQEFALDPDTTEFIDVPAFGVHRYRVKARNRGYTSGWTGWRRCKVD